MKKQSEKQVYSLQTVVSERKENQHTYLLTSICIKKHWRDTYSTTNKSGY